MATIVSNVLVADGKPATLFQVVSCIIKRPPVYPADLVHCCFPGELANSSSIDEWKSKLEELIQKVDERMVPIAAANIIWRKTLKHGNSVKVGYYRPDDRIKIKEVTEGSELGNLLFRDIMPGSDGRISELRGL